MNISKSSGDKFDMIIAGAGAAGLSLLWHLLSSEQFSNYRILLADISFEPKNDKTWCFWDDTHLPDHQMVYHSWKDLELRVNSRKIRETLSRYEYYCVRSSDFSEKILSAAENDERVTFLEAKITDFTYDGRSPLMKTNKGDYRAEMIFQSVIKPPQTDNMKSDISLKQHFLGWEVETKDDIFDPKRAIFMDFEVPQKEGVTFLYVLPFSPNRALIEYTLFSENLLTKGEYEEALNSYIKLNYGLADGDYSIVRREKGVIPMEDQRYPETYCKEVYNIGTMGGVTKPSSGYAFTRILKHSKSISEAILARKPIPQSPASTYRFRVYDMMLLNILKNEPDTSLRIFHDLFHKNGFDRILHFLEEKTNFGQELKIFSSVPYSPFLKSIWKMKHRIFTGA